MHLLSLSMDEEHILKILGDTFYLVRPWARSATRDFGRHILLSSSVDESAHWRVQKMHFAQFVHG